MTYASLPRRLAAFGLDYAALALYLGLLALFAVALMGAPENPLSRAWADPLRGQGIGLHPGAGRGDPPLLDHHRGWGARGFTDGHVMAKVPQ